ncbi:MAG: hydroxyacid dehydrogenase [Anaerolineaceae bacterium]|nr:hydroxyacid dehydrogenase [Anaerolineaceae bacterium]
MKIVMFSAKPYERKFFDAANADYHHDMTYLEPRLTPQTAPLAEGYPAVCIFVNDQANAEVIEQLAQGGTKLLALRSAGYNHVDLTAAEKHGIRVVRVPAYSPYAVAEHTVGLILTLNRKTHRAYARVREGNFELDGLLGFDIHGLTVGVVGTGKIGIEVARIMHGFGCRLLGYDPYPNPAASSFGLDYVELDALLGRADIITLHSPLTPETYHLINEQAIALFKPGAMLINTSRGALVDAAAAIEGLKTGQIGYLGLDVYEEESDLFFEDLSDRIIQDDVFARLLTFPNVVITGHQAFFTRNALLAIADTTLANIHDVAQTGESANEVTAAQVTKP